MSKTKFHEYKFWDVSTRIFHWVNYTAIICLIIFDQIMLFKKELGITCVDAMVGLKESLSGRRD